MKQDSLLLLQTMLHYKAQYLAALNNSFLPWAKDDSQSNLGWNSESNSLVSRDIENGSHLELNYLDFSLTYFGKGFQSTLDLSSISNYDIELWVKAQLKRDGLDLRKFGMKLNYKLVNFEAQIEHWNDQLRAYAETLAQWRSHAQKALEHIGEFYSAHSEVRIWPHHFDTGMLIDFGDHYMKGVGLGYAIKDSVCDQPYYYAYAWSDEDIDYSDLPKLHKGLWKMDDWKGAVLPASTEVSQSDVFEFYNEALNTFADLL